MFELQIWLAYLKIFIALFSAISKSQSLLMFVHAFHADPVLQTIL